MNRSAGNQHSSSKYLKSGGKKQPRTIRVGWICIRKVVNGWTCSLEVKSREGKEVGSIILVSAVNNEFFDIDAN